MPSISFAQAFAINKGANFVNLIPFKGIPISSLLNGTTLQSFPNVSNYVPDIHNGSSLTYTLANSSNTFNNQLVFKYGGDVGSIDVHTLSTKITQITVSVSGGLKPSVLYGDYVFVAFSAGTTLPGKININGRYIELETSTSTSTSIQGSRSELVANYNNTQPSFDGTVNGYLFFDPPLVTKMYWSGFVNPKQTNSEYYDFRIAVGYFREHTGLGGILYHPQVGGIAQRMAFDGLIGYHVFVDVNDNLPKWWALVLARDLATGAHAVISAYATGAIATSYNKLEIECTNTNYIFKVNGTTVGTASLINPAIYDLQSYPLMSAVVIRAMKYTQSNNTLPIDKALKISTDNLVWVNVTIPSEGNPSLAETGLHNTGLRLLKKLK